jgi:putative transposase
MSEFRNLSKAFWGRHIWGRGYFVASSGNVTDEVIIQYIELQGKEPEDGDICIEGEL